MSIDRAMADVASPPFTPIKYDLLATVDVLTPTDSRWENGVQFQPDACEAALTTWDRCAATGGGSGIAATKSPSTTGIGLRGAEPFTVYAWILCSPVGHWDDYERRTTTALTNGELRAMESVFWTGVVQGQDVNPHLAEDAAITNSAGVLVQTAASVVTTGAAVDVVEAVGLLEGSLSSCYGGEGIIHVPRSALAHLAANMLVVQDGTVLRTMGGTKVAAYASNNREGPTGAAPAAGQAWFYATGAVQLRRSAIRVTSREQEALNRTENTMVFIAERTYVIDWDCCHLAAQVSLGGVITGGSQAA